MSSGDGEWPAIVGSSLAQEAYALIRERILDGRLAGGAALKDSVLAAQMGVSRAPVRQALERLVQSGLASKLPNKPYRVVCIDAEALSELRLMRFADESAAIIQLVASGAVLEPLRERIREMAEVVAADGGWAPVVDADLAFHRELVRLTGLPRLTARFDGLCDQIRTWLNSVDVPLMVIETQVQRHTELLDALGRAQSTQDTQPAIAFWRAHILGDHRWVLADRNRP
ncbi:GntR family transcriptional regulator [Streptomyces sp. NPDC056660]|uniref:GntR family transcriptional regulator n=1 Tax=Streptomyces sp. NPDC056660 TaxID=3345897 RepID=UPI0036BD7564